VASELGVNVATLQYWCRQFGSVEGRVGKVAARGLESELQAEKASRPVILLCETLEVSTSAFYEWSNAQSKPGHSKGILESIGKTGSAYNNAITETFFSTLKKELIHGERFKTRKEATAEIFEHIEVFYNRTRMHSSLGHKSPVMLERDVA
jgi:hypothetical protein